MPSDLIRPQRRLLQAIGELDSGQPGACFPLSLITETFHGLTGRPVNRRVLRSLYRRGFIRAKANHYGLTNSGRQFYGRIVWGERKTPALSESRVEFQEG